MKTDQMLRKVQEILTEYRSFESLSSLLMWDQWQSMPAQGAVYHHGMSGFAAQKAGEVLASADAKACARYFADFDLSALESDLQRGMVRLFLYRYRYSELIPSEMQTEMAMLEARGQAVWLEARKKSDYNLFRPVLHQIFDLKRAAAECIDNGSHPLQTLAGMNDEGIDLDETGALLGALKDGISDLLSRIQRTGIDIDDRCLDQNIDTQALQAVVKLLVEQAGYDSAAGGYGEAVHPFTALIGPRDVRITANYDSFRSGVFSAIHEAGHAMYGQRSDDAVVEHLLWGGNMGGFHESQARFYENILGRSKPFWTWFFPEMQKTFPGFGETDLETFYRAVNRVTPSCNRMLADELTYSLHAIIRFELERDILDGKLPLDRLPDLWNDKYEEVLGIRPSDDTEGVLQDVHWSMGVIGYFQSYALGNLYGGQFRHALLKDVPDVYDRIAGGCFEPLNDWMTDKIHRHGCTYAPREMVRRVTGEPLNSRYFLDYLNEKYTEIYHLT